LPHHIKSIGNGLKKYAERSVTKENNNDEFLDKFVSMLARRYRENSMVKTVPFDGIFKLLKFLEDENIIINILSNKRDEFVKELVAHYFPDLKFKCANGELPKVPQKPDPSAALNIAKECNISPEEILFIGDSIYDIQTGKNAKMKTIAVTWGYQPQDMLLKENPDFLANKPEDIVNYIKSNS
ncbi:MAG: HAD family hydrolase, partial [Clostridia bacterium]|nr:HAD family hydrolase [Clostridia bacterium]